jgi:DNA-binding Lrp family transcriptional regulator
LKGLIDNMTKLDQLDKLLISILRSDARTPVVKLAKKLNVSRATIQNRMQLLESRGIILNYTVNLKSSAEVNPIRAFMSIAVEGKKSPAVVSALMGIPQIATIHNTNGRWDLIADIRTHSLEAFNALLGEVRTIDGVSSTETSLLLDTLKR